MDDKREKQDDWSSTAIKLGILLIVLAVVIGGVIVVFQIVENLPPGEEGESRRKESFQVTGAIHSTKFDETGINLTYYGSEPVNVSIYSEEWFYGELLNRTRHIGIMHKGDTVGIGFHGYATLIEVIYNNKRVKLAWIPERK